MAQTQRTCPSCAAPMTPQEFGRKPFGTLQLDLCFPCQAIWFDQYESAQLAPEAVLQLFRTIHEHRDDHPRPMADSMRCVTCRGRLQLTHDVQRNNRISYYRCVAGHGRLTTFFQFLREKNFVRSLTGVEIEQLKVHIAQVRCSGCGAPIDLERDAQCSYCHAPLSILDADAVNRTLAELTLQAQRPARRVDPDAAVDALFAGQRFERKMERLDARSGAWIPGSLDLVREALDFLMSTH